MPYACGELYRQIGSRHETSQQGLIALDLGSEFLDGRVKFVKVVRTVVPQGVAFKISPTVLDRI